MKLHVGFVAALMILMVAVPRNGTAAENPFRQTELAIGFWVDPPMDGQADARYKEIAEANFTLVVGGFGARSPEQVRRQLDLCEKYGLKALVWEGRHVGEHLPSSGACLGYMLQDEPATRDFPRLGEEAATVRRRAPGKLAFVNLLPNYASPLQLGASDYPDYLDRFVRTVHPGVLSTDHYPLFRPGSRDPRPLYRKNLSQLRAEAQKAGIPFWMFFNTMPYGPHTDPTEAQLRWQVYTSLTYGAKGVLYFCYYTPAGREFSKGGAIIDHRDRQTRHYEQVRRINGELKNLGPTLMKLTSGGVIHLEGKRAFGPGDLTGAPLAALKVVQASDPALNMEIGVFRHADGREAVMVMNNDITYTAWPTIEFKGPAEAIVEIDKRSGKAVPVYDESPDIPGVQVSFDAGEGRLFLIHPKSK